MCTLHELREPRPSFFKPLQRALPRSPTGVAPTAETSHLRNNGHDFAAPRASLRANPRDATPRILLVNVLLVLLVLVVLVLVDIRLVQDDTLWLQDGAGG